MCSLKSEYEVQGFLRKESATSAFIVSGLSVSAPDVKNPAPQAEVVEHLFGESRLHLLPIRKVRTQVRISGDR
jgi:hypothetical protein